MTDKFPLEIKTLNTDKLCSTSKKSFQIKQNVDDDFFHIEGYASTFGNVDRGGDVIVKGSFAESISDKKPSFLWVHSFENVIGIVDAVSEDEVGLYVKCRMPKSDTLVHGRVIPQIEIGSIKSFSIGYFAQEYDHDEDGCRIIKKVNLLEVSLVPMPMNPDSVITSAKTLDITDAKKIKTKRDFECALRELGASKKSAVYLASQFQPPVQSDSDSDADVLLTAINQLKSINQR